MKLALYVTSHGFGHLTRALEVGRLLRSAHPEVELHLRADFPTEVVEAALGEPPRSHAPVRLEVGLVQRDSLSWDPVQTLERLEHFFGPEGDRLVEAEARWLEAAGIDAALVDISPRAFDACALAGVPADGLSNFGWDWIWEGLAADEPAFGRFAARARESYGRCRLLYRTKMDDGLDAFPRQERVPLVARSSRLPGDEVRRRLGVDLHRPVVALSYGGDGVRDLALPGQELLERFTFVVSGSMAELGPPTIRVTDSELAELGLRYCDLVRAADVVMTKPGYSIVAECAANRTALVYTERGAFREQASVLRFIRRYLPNAALRADELRRGRWAPALDRALEASPRGFIELDVEGAAQVADRVWQRRADDGPGVLH